MTSTWLQSKGSVRPNVSGRHHTQWGKLVTFITTHHPAASGGLISSPGPRHTQSHHTDTHRLCAFCRRVAEQDEAVLLEGCNTLPRTAWREHIFLIFQPKRTHAQVRTHTRGGGGKVGRGWGCAGIRARRLEMNKNQKDRRGMKSTRHFTRKRSDTNKMQLYWENSLAENMTLDMSCDLWSEET